ncbi:amidase [Arthrobacter sp. Soil782]|uniref:amidase n=1 Tax=Arthrobacter sp. Soil782 TaxID=1736410 RepID=UPI000700F585|nr:amidase [Arthrobacter sp. Soil782]KRF09093.1 amidase [Arthrobacter sp. Soil782]
MSSLSELTALEQRDLLRRGELSSRELTTHYLDRIDARNMELGAFVTVTADAALAEAEGADQRQASGADLPLLHGLPLAHKDLTDVAGVVTTHGSAALQHTVAAADSPLVAVLRRAGAVSVGKTQVPEFGLSCYSENLVAPPSRNPLNPALSSGGSSGGSAAAVAAGLIPFAPGTDGGGSVRIPAAATGLIGLKPNRGRVPSGAGQSDLGQFVVAGPLARTTADAALLLDAMVNEPNFHATSAAAHGPFLDAALRADGRFRIGVSTASPFAAAFPIELDDAAQAGFDAGVNALGAVGHEILEADLRYDPRYHEAFQTVWTAGLAVARIPADREKDLTTLARTLRRRAQGKSATDLASAVDILRQFEQDTIAQYSAFDIIATPALGMVPRPIGWYTDADADTDYLRQCQYSPYTSMVNVCGLPAISVPVFTTAEGLSMSIQLIGRPSAEADLLTVSAQLEEHLRTGQNRT